MSRQTGNFHEQQAAKYLQKQGLRLVTRNFSAYRGELDLVMLDKNTLVFIEVRYRKASNYGSAAESVTVLKQQHMLHAAQRYLQLNSQYAQLACRFDVIAINGTNNPDSHPKIDWIKNAFLIT